MTHCPHCNNRGWVKSATPDRPVNLCACAYPKRAWRPPGWAWGLAAFVGIVIANAIVPNAHGATLSATADADYTTVLLVLACLGGVALAGLALIVMCLGRTRAEQLDQARRDALLHRVRQEAEALDSRAARHTPAQAVDPMHQAMDRNRQHGRAP